MKIGKILITALFVLASGRQAQAQNSFTGAAEVMLQFNPEQPSMPDGYLEVHVFADLGAVRAAGGAMPLLTGYSIPVSFDPSRVSLVSAIAGDAFGFEAGGFAATDPSVANARGFVTTMNTRTGTADPGSRIELARLVFRIVRSGKALFLAGSARTVRSGSLSASPTGTETSQRLAWAERLYSLQIAPGDIFSTLFCPSWFSKSGMFQGMAFLNEGTQETIVQFYGWSADGSLVQSASATNPTRPAVLSPMNQDARVTEQIFEASAAMEVEHGWIEAKFSGPDISGFFIQGVSYDIGIAQLDGADMPYAGSKRIVFPLIGGNADRKAEICLINPGADPVTANMSVLNADGTLSQAVTLVVPAHGTRVREFAQNTGYVSVETEGGSLLGFERFGTGEALAVLNGQDPLLASNRLSGPQFASGLLAGDLRTDTHITIVNPSAAASRVVLRLLNEQGREITSAVTRSIAAGAQISSPGWALFGLEDPATTAKTIVGTLTVESDQGLVGALTFGDPVHGTYMSSLPLLSTSAAKREIFFSHVAAGRSGSSDFFTGLALANPSASATAHIVLELYTSNGTLVAKTKIPYELCPNCRTAQLVQQLIPDFVGPQFGGFIHLTSDVEVYAYSLFGDSAFNFLSAIPVR